MHFRNTTTTFTVAQAMLIAAVTGLSQQNANGETSARLQDGDLFIRKEITGAGGTIDLITAATVKTNGVTSFDKNRMPATLTQVLERIRFGYATAASGNTDGEAGQRYTNVYGSVPAFLANADLIITNGEKNILEVPVARLLTMVANEGVIGSQDCFELDALRLLKANTQLEIKLRFPEGKSLDSTAKHFVEIHLIGPQAQERA